MLLYKKVMQYVFSFNYLNHGVELHSVSPTTCSKTNAGLAGSPGRVYGAVVAGTVAAPASRTVIKPPPIIPIGLKVLTR